MSEDTSPKGLAAVAAVAVLAAVFFFARSQADLGPLDTAKAEALVDAMVQDQIGRYRNNARLDVVTESGQGAKAPAVTFTSFTVAECETLFNKKAESRGRWGQNRSFATAEYECLFRARGPDALTFHLGAAIQRTSDTRDGGDGYTSRLLNPKDLKALIARFEVPQVRLTASEQEALAAKLAEHNITLNAE